MKNNVVFSLNSIEVDLLTHILNEVVSEHKIPEIIDETTRQELFAELDIVKILTDLEIKIRNEKFLQLEDVDSGEGKKHAVVLCDWEIGILTSGDGQEVETVVECILNQVKEEV